MAATTDLNLGLAPDQADRLRDARTRRRNLTQEDRDLLASLPPVPQQGGGRNGPDGRRFPWGAIVRTHSVGDIDVVEYLRDCSNLTPLDARVNHGQTLFHAYIDGRDISRSATSLDSALVQAITYKRRGPNDNSAHAFDLMTLGVLPE